MRSCPAVEGIEIVDKGFHSLISLFLNVMASTAINRFKEISVVGLSKSVNKKTLDIADSRNTSVPYVKLRTLMLQPILQALEVQQLIVHAAIDDTFADIIYHRFSERLSDSLCHCKIKSIDTLPAEHIVLIGLNSNASQ